MVRCGSCSGTGVRSGDLCRPCRGLGEVDENVLGIKLLRVYLSKEENKELDRVGARKQKFEYYPSYKYEIDNSQSPSHTLQHLFSWGGSPQRDGYWREIYRKLRDGGL